MPTVNPVVVAVSMVCIIALVFNNEILKVTVSLGNLLIMMILMILVMNMITSLATAPHKESESYPCAHGIASGGGRHSSDPPAPPG